MPSSAPVPHPAPTLEPAARLAVDADEAAIAGLHAESWRVAYRGVLRDRWLDDEALADRQALWRSRFAAPPANQRILVVDTACGTRLAGFACVYLDAHPTHGSLLENLHVAPEFKGRGIGGRLLRESARLAGQAAPGHGFHLSVVRANTAARGFYEHLGAHALEEEAWHAPDGQVIACEVMGWARASDLA